MVEKNKKMGKVPFSSGPGQATENNMTKLYKGGMMCIDPEAALKDEKLWMIHEKTDNKD